MRKEMRSEQSRGKPSTEKSKNYIARYSLEHQAEFELSDDELAYVTGSMFGAGADTVRSFLCCCSLRPRFP